MEIQLLVEDCVDYNRILSITEEQFILRVTPFVAKRLDCLLSENENVSSSEDKSLDLSFSAENEESFKEDTISIREKCLISWAADDVEG
ncbi:hypothetical protein SO802_008935, partial [Lithocarpus litseifolius]